MMITPDTVSDTRPPAVALPLSLPHSLPLRTVLPPLPVAAIAVVLGTAAAAVTVIRPKQLPYSVQATADYAVVITVAAHPFETLFVRHLARRRNLAPSSRRRAQGATLTFGALSLPRVIGAIRRAPKL